MHVAIIMNGNAEWANQRGLAPTARHAGAVDLLVRTRGGCCRSEFMLWEVAYARLHYVDCLWPDFNGRDLQRALACYVSCDDCVK